MTIELTDSQIFDIYDDFINNIKEYIDDDLVFDYLNDHPDSVIDYLNYHAKHYIIDKIKEEWQQ